MQTGVLRILNEGFRIRLPAFIRVHLRFHCDGHEILSKSTAAKTRSGVSWFMQLKWPSGHSRWKHGLHGRSSLRILALEERGGVKSGLVDP